MMRFGLPFLVLVSCVAPQALAQKVPLAVPVAPQEILTPAEQAKRRAAELDRLFGRLQVTESAQEAALLERKIFENWNSNVSPMAEMLLHQAGVAISDGEADAARDILDTVIGTYPDYTEALNRRATFHFDMKRYDDSLLDIEKVLDAEPRHFGALAGRGMILEAQGKFGAAKAAYKEALSINPNMEGVQNALKLLQRKAPDI